LRLFLFFDQHLNNTYAVHIQTPFSLRQHGTSCFICVSVFALYERKNRNTKEDKVPLRKSHLGYRVTRVNNGTSIVTFAAGLKVAAMVTKAACTASSTLCGLYQLLLCVLL
jgi:hypothetical protein